MTRTVIQLVEGPCASDGVQVMTPLDPLMIMPVGAESFKLKLNA